MEIGGNEKQEGVIVAAQGVVVGDRSLVKDLVSILE